ncbi:MAG: hypothetical protein ACQ5SW_00880 [Sphaerochaetaceae bacterium]
MRKRKPYVNLEDLASRYLQGFDADAGVISRVVGAIGLALKSEARAAQRRTFKQHTRKFNRSIWYRQRRKAQRATLYAGSLANIYEKTGALIQPMKGKAMKFEIDGKTIFYTGVIRIPAQPYFYAAMNRAIGSGVDKKAAIKQIAWELKEHNLV